MSRGSIQGMSPRSTSAPATSAGMAERPTFSEEARPLRIFRIEAESTSRSASAASTACPGIAGDDDDRARLARRAPPPPPCRTIGLPSIVATSFVGSKPPAARKRDDWPAASTIAPTLAIGRARLRTRGRSPSADRRRPSRGYRRRGSATPASTRCRTQSKPFSFGDRAQPGAPMIGIPARSASSSRLPGSTGMPKCSIRPPIASIAAGMTSRRSVIAEAPNTTSASRLVDQPPERFRERPDLMRDESRAPRCALRPARGALRARAGSSRRRWA